VDHREHTPSSSRQAKRTEPASAQQATPPASEINHTAELTPQKILQLQRTHGNQFVRRLINRSPSAPAHAPINLNSLLPAGSPAIQRINQPTETKTNADKVTVTKFEPEVMSGVGNSIRAVDRLRADAGGVDINASTEVNGVNPEGWQTGMVQSLLNASITLNYVSNPDTTHTITSAMRDGEDPWYFGNSVSAYKPEQDQKYTLENEVNVNDSPAMVVREKPNIKRYSGFDMIKRFGTWLITLLPGGTEMLIHKFVFWETRVKGTISFKPAPVINYEEDVEDSEKITELSEFHDTGSEVKKTAQGNGSGGVTPKLDGEAAHDSFLSPKLPWDK
jgi:hypothetical protein